MRKNIIGKIITIILIVSSTIMIGMYLGICILVNTDFNKYNNYIIEVAN